MVKGLSLSLFIEALKKSCKLALNKASNEKTTTNITLCAYDWVWARGY